MIWTCEQTEARLSDYLDRAMAGTELTAFEAHIAECDRCAPLVAHVSQLLTGVHAMEQVEAPPRLIYSILDKTLGKRERPSRAGARCLAGSRASARCASRTERFPS